MFLGFGGQERIVLLGSLGEFTQVYFESDAIQAFDLKGSQGLANVLGGEERELWEHVRLEVSMLLGAFS